MKKICSIAFALMLLVTLSACSSGEKSAQTDSAKSSTEQTETVSVDYTNLTVKEAQTLAEKNGVPFRVVEIDGESQMTTMDYVIGRINASIENGIVTSYQVEGQENPTADYNADSWKTMIDKTCSSFFDGCNNCRRAGENDIAACTKKYCSKYAASKCLDEDVKLSLKVSEVKKSFSESLRNCENYSGTFIHPFTSESMARNIVKTDRGCEYSEQMPGNGKMVCLYTLAKQQLVADYYAFVEAGNQVDVSIRHSSETGTDATYTSGDKEIKNPLENFMNDGTCEIIGYE